MESDFLDILGSLFEDAAWFPGCGWAMLVIGVVWLSVYVGGQLTLADVQACQQAQDQCSVRTSTGFFHVLRRQLVSLEGQSAPAVPASPASTAPAKPVAGGTRLVSTPQGALS